MYQRSGLQCVGLHAVLNISTEDGPAWQLVWAHAGLWENKCLFPSLLTIILYGEAWLSLTRGLKAEEESSSMCHAVELLCISVVLQFVVLFRAPARCYVFQQALVYSSHSVSSLGYDKLSLYVALTLCLVARHLSMR
jgi:hypothetical protein